MHPARNLPGAEQNALPFNISLGTPLDQYPVVALALSLLEFVSQDMEFQVVSELIRSPFIAGAERELEVRARLEGIGADGSVSRSPEEFAALVRADTARYAKIVKDIGLRID